MSYSTYRLFMPVGIWYTRRSDIELQRELWLSGNSPPPATLAELAAMIDTGQIIPAPRFGYCVQYGGSGKMKKILEVESMLTANQRKALAALLASKSRVDAARVCGLSTKTLQGYEKLPEFAEALEKGRREALADAAHRIAAGYSETVDTLQDIMQNPATPDASRVAAARVLLEYGIKYAEMTDINRRLDKLEELL